MYELNVRQILTSYLQDLVERRVSVSQIRRNQEDMAELKRNWMQYQTDTLEFKADMQQRVKEEKLKKLSRVREWLAIESQAEQDHAGFREIRKNNSATATWILDHPFVKDWLEADIPTTPWLWMHGIPGAGMICNPTSYVGRLTSCREDHSRFCDH
jgi:hypothetical protein